MEQTSTGMNNRAYQLTILCLLSYLLLFPFLAPLLTSISPALTQCPYAAWTGTPCPFCGTTRALQAFFRHGALPPFHITLALCCLSLEFIRKALLCLHYRRKGSLSPTARKADYLLTSGAVATALTAYLIHWIR